MKKSIFFTVLAISIVLVSCSTLPKGISVQRDTSAKNFWDSDDMLKHLVVSRCYDDPKPEIQEAGSLYTFFEREIYSPARENLRSKRGSLKMFLLKSSVIPGNGTDDAKAELSFDIEVRDRSNKTIWQKNYSGTKEIRDPRFAGGSDESALAAQECLITLESEMLSDFWKDFVDSYQELNSILPNLNDQQGYEKEF